MNSINCSSFGAFDWQNACTWQTNEIINAIDSIMQLHARIHIPNITGALHNCEIYLFWQQSDNEHCVAITKRVENLVGFRYSSFAAGLKQRRPDKELLMNRVYLNRFVTGYEISLIFTSNSQLFEPIKSSSHRASLLRDAAILEDYSEYLLLEPKVCLHFRLFRFELA